MQMLRSSKWYRFRNWCADIHATECSNYIQKDRMTFRRAMGRWQPLIAYSRREFALTYLLSLMFADECKTPLSLGLMRIDSAGTSVTFITLDSTACGYLSHSWLGTRTMPYLTRSTWIRSATVKRLYAVVWSTVFSTLRTANMHNARMAWTCDE